MNPTKISNEAHVDLVCLSHLRWDFVSQRPNHLMSRFARKQRVFFFEEPVWGSPSGELKITAAEHNLWVVTPHLPDGIDHGQVELAEQHLLDALLAEWNIRDYVLWYYTPMALGFSEHLVPRLVVYDCMDELSAFCGAPRQLREREAALLRRADLVFTGGVSLYEAKRNLHPRVFAMPSSVDVQHFRRARQVLPDPADQANIPHPRLGFFGVIDERMDLELIAGIADTRPAWHLVMVGPTAKVDPAQLPHRPNLHYLGKKAYQELPRYLAGWSVALLPFAQNESTRFISPTKTPEYLAGGKPVVATSIRDVVRPYGELGLVHIADTVDEFVAAAERALKQPANNSLWLTQVDQFLSRNSWERTWSKMDWLMQNQLDARRRITTASHQAGEAHPFGLILNSAPLGVSPPHAE